MATKLPGHRLHRLLASCLDERVFTDIVEPTIADLQHEELAATTTSRRMVARLDAYVAIVRVLIRTEFEGPLMSVRAAIIIVLGFGGVLLANWARTQGMDGRVGNSAILLPIFLTPVALRAIEDGRSYWRLLFGSCVVGAIICVGVEFGGSLSVSQPVGVRLLWIAIAGGMACGAGAIAAVLAWSPPRQVAMRLRRNVTGLAYAGVVAGTAFFVRDFVGSHAAARVDALRIPFYACFFSLLLAATCLPLLLIARTWISRRSVLVLVALLSAPISIGAASMVDGNSPSAGLVACFNWSFLISSLPFMAGTAALGWFLGIRADG